MGTELSALMTKFQTAVIDLLDDDYSVEELKDLIEELDNLDG